MVKSDNRFLIIFPLYELLFVCSRNKRRTITAAERTYILIVIDEDNENRFAVMPLRIEHNI